MYNTLKESVVREDRIYQFRRHYVRENKKEVCPTLTANMGTGGHNVPIITTEFGFRKLTPRECFRFQGFPDHYKLPKISNSSLYKQAGNSVSMPVIERLASEIFKCIEKAEARQLKAENF
ncbi:Modification methylase HpaII [compost metagenome]